MMYPLSVDIALEPTTIMQYFHFPNFQFNDPIYIIYLWEWLFRKIVPKYIFLNFFPSRWNKYILLYIQLCTRRPVYVCAIYLTKAAHTHIHDSNIIVQHIRECVVVDVSVWLYSNSLCTRYSGIFRLILILIEKVYAVHQ